MLRLQAVCHIASTLDVSFQELCLRLVTIVLQFAVYLDFSLQIHFTISISVNMFKICSLLRSDTRGK